MIRMIGGVLALVLALPAPGAEDKPASKPPSPRQQYEALVKEQTDAQEAFFKEYRQAKTDAERQKLSQEKYPRPERLAPRFLELAEKNPKDPVAVDALVWVVSNARSAGKDGPRERALAVLRRDYFTSDKLGPLCDDLAYSREAASEALLRQIIAKNPGKDVQGRACLALGMQLHRRMGTAGKEGPAKAEAMLERAAGAYGTVKHPYYGTVGDKARGELYELRHLAVGKEVPDVAGADQDGKKFRLSDYKGKVVLLDFWGNW
jgi:hypothetical protein